MSSFMSRFVFWSGVYNIGLALTLSCPPIYRALGLNLPTPLVGLMLGGFLAYTSVALILASRDLRRRASFVYWESFLRYTIALLVISGGLFGGIGFIAVPMGLVDIIIGLVYMVGLPRELRTSHFALFWDSEKIANPSLVTTLSAP
jgi:hypothetical protein